MLDRTDYNGVIMKVGDLVLCTSAETWEQAIGVIKKKIGIGGTYEVYFFDPPNELWKEGRWTSSHMEVIRESR
jgi:hypothetical protein